MTTDYLAWSRQIQRLHRAVEALQPLAAEIGLAAPEGEEWFELLHRKLLPQVEAPPLLVAAVVGGTNIGKSVIFNHLAGQMASRVSPLAAGTKHPVCLAPAELADEALLTSLFQGFELRRWHSPDDPLTPCPEHLLFWRMGEHVPPRLLLLDTPDIDSDAQVNWQRADHIRQSADVLIAVLTQQKYNDAAVKGFFRKAVEADKPVIVVFNQCDLDGDRDYWPQWLSTFAGETHARPELVYIVPHSRKDAEQLRLPFYEVGSDGRRPLGAASSLRDELASLHFDEIKIRTLRGALTGVLDPRRGAPHYLDRIRAASGEFTAAAAVLSTTEMARVQWPVLPAKMLVDEVRQWWDASRAHWSRTIHGFYRTVGQGIMWPVRKAWGALSPSPPDTLDRFRIQEREAIVLAVEKLLDELDRLAQVGNDTLRPRLQNLLTGRARAELLDRVKASHADLPPLDDDYRAFLRAELDAWGQDNPRAVSVLRSLDHVAAIARPAITVSLVISGWIVAGGIVGDVAVQAAGHSATHLATEAAITGGITGGGEAIVSSTGEGVKQAAAKLFSRLQAHYAETRATWLANWLEKELLGTLLTDLRRGAEVARSEPFQEVEAALGALAEPG